MSHRNIPVFIPHLGCPKHCVFCDQRAISGCTSFQEDAVKELLEASLQTVEEGAETEIAFFGGSFTGIDRGLMLRLLTLAYGYIQQGRVQSVRLSTRPDYIDDAVLELLKRYGVRHIELGLQSMDDAVLTAVKRGHNSACAESACRAVRAHGFVLGGQMMVGLPASTAESECETAKKLCALGVDEVRIYPTVVFHGTELARMTARGEYTPLTVEEAAERSAAVLRIFSEHHVKVLRIGLCASEELSSPQRVLAGPNHPALGELVWNAYYYRLMTQKLEQCGLLGRRVILSLPPRERSKVIGQRRANLFRLQRETGTEVCRIQEEQQARGVSFAPVAERTFIKEGEHNSVSEILRDAGL